MIAGLPEYSRACAEFLGAEPLGDGHAPESRVAIPSWEEARRTFRAGLAAGKGHG
jgi:hypothetical protein